MPNTGDRTHKQKLRSGRVVTGFSMPPHRGESDSKRAPWRGHEIVAAQEAYTRWIKTTRQSGGVASTVLFIPDGQFTKPIDLQRAN